MQEALLQRLAKRVDAVLSLAQVAKAGQDLAVVGGQDHHLGVVAAEH